MQMSLIINIYNRSSQLWKQETWPPVEGQRSNLNISPDEMIRPPPSPDEMIRPPPSFISRGLTMPISLL